MGFENGEKHRHALINALLKCNIKSAPPLGHLLSIWLLSFWGLIIDWTGRWSERKERKRKKNLTFSLQETCECKKRDVSQSVARNAFKKCLRFSKCVKINNPVHQVTVMIFLKIFIYLFIFNLAAVATQANRLIAGQFVPF